MRKNLTQIIAVVGLLLACQLPLEAQSQTASFDLSGQKSSQVTFTFLEAIDENSETLKVTSELLDLPLQQKERELLTSQGAFYDEVVNHMYVNTNFDGKFTKVEILNKYASGLVYTGDLENSPYSKFETVIGAGTYLIILTNEAGEILVDEINVILAPRAEPLEVLASEELIEDLPAVSR